MSHFNFCHPMSVFFFTIRARLHPDCYMQICLRFAMMIFLNTCCCCFFFLQFKTQTNHADEKVMARDLEELITDFWCEQIARAQRAIFVFGGKLTKNNFEKNIYTAKSPPTNRSHRHDDLKWIFSSLSMLCFSLRARARRCRSRSVS